MVMGVALPVFASRPLGLEMETPPAVAALITVMVVLVVFIFLGKDRLRVKIKKAVCKIFDPNYDIAYLRQGHLEALK